MYKIAVLSSTNGTNFQSILDAKARGELENVEISCLITNKADCGAAQKARDNGIKVFYIDPREISKEKFDESVMATLDFFQVDLVVLGGYMKIIGPELVEKYENRIINIHPSLLPKFAGGMDTDVHQAVIDAGEKETGMTIHVVTEEVDSGPVILQKSVEVSPDDSAESLKEKVQALEKEWYPKVIQQFADGEIQF
ncbi:phosphoribosylglycinamide formyltransferase [Patescibacteria group bacterium]|nr:phosphoribosylglycinamide formyltransferase [Patescibacteria group bacterium]MBU1682428.1 phosphoribosylglycinamide formyltransferase [Patescibacteria group bacterium]MBU1934719.1 phosphoribosylglycinamide formyltransferase [Patescibacteria group bacterium]